MPYFSLAARVQPHEVKWQLMVASCYRRIGNYQQVSTSNHLSASICSFQQQIRDCCNHQDMRDSFSSPVSVVGQVLSATQKLLKHLQQTHSDASE